MEVSPNELMNILNKIISKRESFYPYFWNELRLIVFTCMTRMSRDVKDANWCLLILQVVI